MGLVSIALMLPISAGNVGLVPNVVANHLLGEAGSALIPIMLFMAIVFIHGNIWGERVQREAST